MVVDAPSSAQPAPGADGPLVQVRRLYKIFKEAGTETVPLRGANLELRRGQVTSLVGPSGSGKSTLISILAGLALPSAGEVLIGGEDITRMDEVGRARTRARHIGVVMQSGNLVPFLTALENVELVMMLADRGGNRKRAIELLGGMGLAGRMHHLPRRLSGGEAQRVAIAVALANEPDLLLADELTGELDSETSNDLMDVVHRAWREQGVTAFLVTHNLELAASAQQRLRLDDGMVVDS